MVWPASLYVSTLSHLLDQLFDCPVLLAEVFSRLLFGGPLLMNPVLFLICLFFIPSYFDILGWNKSINLKSNPVPLVPLTAWPPPEVAPCMQASWSGEAVRAVRDGFTLAPCSSSSSTHSRLPEAQALHRGVLPWMVRTSTWRNRREKSTSHLVLCNFWIF